VAVVEGSRVGPPGLRHSRPAAGCTLTVRAGAMERLNISGQVPQLSRDSLLQ
jgi:hypothetical protein